MITTIILVLVYGTLLASVALCILFGRKKGMNGTLITSGITVAAIVIAMILAMLLAPTVSDFALETISGFLSGDIQTLMNSSAGMQTLVKVIACGICLPFLFFLFYIVLQIVGSIVGGIFTRGKSDERAGEGMAIGVLRGLLITLALTFPLMTTFSLVDTVIEEHPALEAELTEMVGQETLDAVKKASSANLPYRLFKDNLVKGMLSTMSATEFEGTRVDAYTALEDVSVTLEAAVPLTEGKIDFMHLTDKQISDIDNFLYTLNESPVLSSVLADIVCECSAAWADGRSFMGIGLPKETQSGILANVFTQLLSVLATSNRETVVPNLHTLIEALEAIGQIDMDALTSGSKEDLKQLCESGALDKMIEPFMKNSNMESVSMEIGSLGMWAAASAIIPSKDEVTEIVDKYENLMAEVAYKVEQYTKDPDALSNELWGMVVEYGVDVTKTMVDCIVDVLLEEQEKHGGSLTTADMKALFEEYSEKYASGNFQLP